MKILTDLNADLVIDMEIRCLSRAHQLLTMLNDAMSEIRAVPNRCASCVPLRGAFRVRERERATF